MKEHVGDASRTEDGDHQWDHTSYCSRVHMVVGHRMAAYGPHEQLRVCYAIATIEENQAMSSRIVKYLQQLSRLELGCALWVPDPANLYDCIEVGDVGYIRDGHFHRLFNALLPKDHPSHDWGVPEDFETLVPTHTPTVRLSSLEDGAYISHTIRVIDVATGVSAPMPPVPLAASLSISCSGHHGAVLAFPDEAIREDAIQIELFQAYIVKHYESWHAYTTSLHLGLRQEDIVFITGCDKTSSWAVAAFTEKHVDGKVSLEALGLGSASVQISWKDGRHVHHNRGPRPASLFEGHQSSRRLSNTSRPNVRNQCIFLRGFRAKKRPLWYPKVMKAAAEPQDYDYQSDQEPSSELAAASEGEDVEISSLVDEDEASAGSQGPDLLTCILDYILENADVETAVAHEDQLKPFVLSISEPTPSELRKYLITTRPKINVSGNNGSQVGVLAKFDRNQTRYSKLVDKLRTVLRPRFQGRLRRPQLHVNKPLGPALDPRMLLATYTFWPLLVGLTIVDSTRQPMIPVLFATLVAGLGLRLGYLTLSASRAVFVLVIAMLFLPLHMPCLLLIGLHVLSSRARRIGADIKAAVEDERRSDASIEHTTARQLLSKYAFVLVATFLWGAMNVDGFPMGSAIAGLFGVRTTPYEKSGMCPIDARVSNGWSRALLFGMLGHLGCTIGDTLSSEFGLLVREPPLLLTTFRPVKPGTNGGVTFYGTLSSLLGGDLAGAAMWTLLMLENTDCNARKWEILPQFLWWGLVAGGLGSWLDSMIGAIFQQTLYSNKSRRILTDASDPRKKTETGLKTVSGFDVLTNGQVNLISTTVTALVLANFA